MIFFHFLGAACVGAFFFTVSYIHYAATLQTASQAPTQHCRKCRWLSWLLLAVVAAGPGWIRTCFLHTELCEQKWPCPLQVYSVNKGERRGWKCTTTCSSHGHALGEQWGWRKPSGWDLAHLFAPTSILEYSQIFTGRSLYRWGLDQIDYNDWLSQIDCVTKKYYSVVVPCP